MNMSLMHRATGVGMALGVSGASIGLVATGTDFSAALATLAALPAPVIFLGKFTMAWPFTYHTFNGVRHLAWDAVLGFEIPQLYKSGWFVVGSSAIAAAGLAVL
jgi:succinate dehydrogenase (ubiquinone) cytochrome b560 subunit